MRLLTVGPTSVGFLLLCFGTASAAPFPTLDQNPLLAGFGSPGPMPAHIPAANSWDWAADFNWASSAIVQSSSRESLIVDAETRELRLSLAHSFGDRWAVRLEAPYRYTGAGTLDSFIDSWHDFFSLPEGMRPDLPQNDLRVAYERDGETIVDARSSAQGIGDVSAAVGYQWRSDEDSSLAAWLRIELPTGDADDFAGSGGTDVSLAIAGEHRIGERWAAFGQATVTYLGHSDLFAQQQKDLVWSGLAGIGVDVWRGLELKAQLDAHTASFDDTDLDYLSEAVILTVGGAWKFRSGWQLDLGVSEDIAVDASPDVVFVIGVRR
jgi:hypothetical protein